MKRAETTKDQGATSETCAGKETELGGQIAKLEAAVASVRDLASNIERHHVLPYARPKHGILRRGFSVTCGTVWWTTKASVVVAVLVISIAVIYTISLAMIRLVRNDV